MAYLRRLLKVTVTLTLSLVLVMSPSLVSRDHGAVVHRLGRAAAVLQGGDASCLGCPTSPDVPVDSGAACVVECPVGLVVKTILQRLCTTDPNQIAVIRGTLAKSTHTCKDGTFQPSISFCECENDPVFCLDFPPPPLIDNNTPSKRRLAYKFSGCDSVIGRNGERRGMTYNCTVTMECYAPNGQTGQSFEYTCQEQNQANRETGVWALQDQTVTPQIDPLVIRVKCDNGPYRRTINCCLNTNFCSCVGETFSFDIGSFFGIITFLAVVYFSTYFTWKHVLAKKVWELIGRELAPLKEKGDTGRDSSKTRSTDSPPSLTKSYSTSLDGFKKRKKYAVIHKTSSECQDDGDENFPRKYGNSRISSSSARRMSDPDSSEERSNVLVVGAD